MSKVIVPLIFLLSRSATSDDSASEVNCQSWPKFSKLPIECCSVPDLFKPEIKEACLANCSRPNEPSFNTWCCTTQCIFEEIGLTDDGHFSRENAKNVLPKVFEDAEKIDKSLSEIIDKCDEQISKTELKQDAGKTECATLNFGYILSCIHQELMKLCPESKPDSECVELKEFMEKCPNLQPPLKHSKVKSADEADHLGEAMDEVIRRNENGKTK